VNTLICLEGVSYAGKTTIAKWLTERMPALYGPRVASGWEEREEKVHHNPDPLARFSFLMEEIAARSEQIKKLLERTDVVSDRYLLSIIAYHNIIMGARLETGIDAGNLQLPDFTVLLTVDETALKQRMKNRPPRHRYESDPMFLLEVQRELLRLIDREKSIIVDTSTWLAEDIANTLLGEFIRRGFVQSQFPQRE
jgi:thymidylate kinase